MKQIDAGATTTYVGSATVALKVTRHPDFPQTEKELQELWIEGIKELSIRLTGNNPDIIQARVIGPQSKHV